MNTNTKTNPLVPILAAIWIFWAFGCYTIGERLWTQLDGVVTSSRDIPFLAYSGRYATQYTILGRDGHETTYTAGCTDGSLPRSMPVGTVLRKIRWHLDFERDGQTIPFAQLPFYFLTFAVGIAFLIWGIVLYRSRRKVRPAEASA
jgi:hypothetical protein